MKTVYVVTHPEATHHVDGLVGGQFDSDLTERGRHQAGAIAEALAARLPADATVTVSSSDLLRTRRTAEAVAERWGTDVVLDPRLREKSYGEAGGRPQAWLDDRFIPPPAEGERMRHHEGVAGAETKWDLAVRVYAAAEAVFASPAEHHVVVTHGMAATYLLAAWIEMPLEAAGRVSFRLTSGGITTLHRDDYFHNHSIRELNNVEHLHR
ncbi:putative phosphoglycerate mutase [Bogoriella caseilytica]|uniref:Putative phosphoglycerate mutase n=1 Tax=Bogoriella caseilytica TaxID=56055 RepID=A0A3N2BC76_9MICO|nr:putative phosphoglycerate mutase [Bogoriella caseilytica]